MAKLVTGLIVSLGVVFVSWQCLQRESSVRLVRHELERWRTNGFIDEIGDSRTRVLHAITNPAPHPELSSQATLVYEWLAWESRLTRARSINFRQTAVELSLTTLAKRPANADAWASLCSNLWLTEGFSASTEYAFYRAFELGGWELQTQRTLAQLGIRYWDQINESVRPIVTEIVRRGIVSDMTHHPERLDRQIIDLAYQHRWQHLLQPLLVNADQRAYFSQLASGGE